MNIYQRVISRHEQLVLKGPQHADAVIQERPQGYIIGIPAEGKGPEASVRLLDYDRYSVILRHIEVVDKNLLVQQNSVRDYLQCCAAAMVQRLTYLEEPLQLLEVDAVEGIAQLRSSPPQQHGDGIHYWELTLRHTPHPQAKLTRYRWQPGDYGRNQLPYPITGITLARIANDLAVGLTVDSG